ncbi:MAG: ATP-binding protein, partial [Synergistaceae bacterium]|nr:ATP-binding protein [Synergistaceae bacterium]
MIKAIRSIVHNRREMFSLLLKIICVLLAFLIMIASCDIFVGNTFHNRLIREVTGVLESTKRKIEYEINIPQTVLAFVSQSVRDMLLNNASEEEMQDYLNRISDYIRNNEKMLIGHYNGIYGLFNVFGDKYLSGFDWQISDRNRSLPRERSWYNAAVDAIGEIAITVPYDFSYNEEPVITLSYCIFDNDGNQLCVLCLDIPMDNINKHISDVSISEGSYGILIYKNIYIMSHPTLELVGKKTYEVDNIFSGFIDELESGIDFAEKEGENYEGVLSILYFSHLGDDWTVSIVVPKDEYFNELNNMRLIIVIIGVIMAIVLSILLASVELRKKKAIEREQEADIQKQAAQAANEAKSAFLANMSHEIRTPMNAVLGMTELLLHENLTPRQLQYVEDMKLSATALLGIINDILDISKIQSNKFSLVLVHYDFDMLIDNIGSITQFLIDAKNIAYKLTMQEHPHLFLHGDDVRLRQVLLNLLGNAVKFTNDGYITLSVSFTETTIKIAVSDTGIGVPPENIATLFDAFEQADTMTNRSTKGTGLGLTITKSIVEMMDGTIWVESVYGKGSTFHVEIPKILGDESLIQHSNIKDNVICAPDAKVLVVDDNGVNLNVARGLLQIFQIKVDTAESGMKAIEMVQQNSYDLIFMDHRMPGMTGIETATAVREMGITIPIIALTASVYPNAKERMLIAGMNDYLTKPLLKTELIRILQKWIPAEKIIEAQPIIADGSEYTTDEYRVFWDKIEAIDGLDFFTGLDRVSGQRDVYEKTLKLMMLEIEKSNKNLIKFLSEEDMGNFGIEVHGIKGTLANIGAMDLSARALDLENASDKWDTAFCISNLPDFLKMLNELYAELDNAFSSLVYDDDSIS